MRLSTSHFALKLLLLQQNAATVLQLPGKAHDQLEGLASDDGLNSTTIIGSRMHSAIDGFY